MLKKITLLFLFVVACAESARAQSEFQPGYIVPLAGDTVRGQVAMQGTQRSIRRCIFRSAATETPVTYLPGQLKGYGIWQVKQYRSGLVPVVDTVRQQQFMEILVLGKATLLLSSDDNNDPRFFLQRAGRPAPEELRLITRTQSLNGRLYKQEINQYQQTLLVAFADYPALAPRIQRARFVVQDLVDLFERYNTNAGGAVQVGGMAKARTRFRLGLVAGLPVSSKLNVKSPGAPGYYNVALNSPFNPVFGLQMAFNNPRLSQRLWLQVCALYERRNYSGESRDGRLVTVNDNYYGVGYGGTFVHVPVVLRFEALKGFLRPVVEIGISSNFRLNESRNDITTFYKNNQAPTQRQLFETPRAYEQGALAGAGLTSALPNGHHVTLLLRYELSNGFSQATAISSTAYTLLGLLSYDLVGK